MTIFKKVHQANGLAFRKIYDEYFQELFVYARSITRSNDLAKDAVTEVFVSFWKSDCDVHSIKNLKSYLLVSVKNECIKMLYKSSNEMGLDDCECFEYIEKISPEDVLLEKELLVLIRNVVESLPPQCQLIFKMAKDEGKTYKEIANELGISVSTVGNQVSRAIQAIREKYDDETSYDGIFSNMAMFLFLISISSALSI